MWLSLCFKIHKTKKPNRMKRIAQLQLLPYIAKKNMSKAKQRKWNKNEKNQVTKTSKNK